MNSCFHSIEFQGGKYIRVFHHRQPYSRILLFLFLVDLFVFCFFEKTYSELRISYDKLAGLPLWGFPFRLTKEAAPG